MSLATWYHRQYSTWNRTRRLQQSQYLARTDTNTSRVAAAMAQAGQSGGITLANINGQNADTANNNAANTTSNQKKTQEPLFGPNIGAVSMGPPWTVTTEKKMVTDDLTPEIVSTWVERSKEPSQPTTTLQALVNLKRPSLRLSPLTSSPDDSTSPLPLEHQHHHGLEFEYDCDAPKCGIYVYVFLSKDHPDAPSTHYSMAKLLVFETVVDGGFGKTLKLEEGALLELGRFEHVPNRNANADAPRSSTSPPPAGETSEASPATSTDGLRHVNRRRFTHFHFRKRSHNQSVSGPALAVVDAEPASAQDTKKEGKDEMDGEGVRVTIRLAALDEQGAELASPNEQVTYLHIVRFGAKPAAPEGEAAPASETEDTRPWVVKVVKREATIGPHTFHLHEIYGLTSSSSHSYAPTSTLPSPTTDAHTYPPESAPPAPAAAEEDDPQSECLLCLSAPREVVLLPCRHLVACKDCALNMVEFGAGGNITQAAEPAAGGDGAEGGEPSAAGGAGTQAAAAANVTPTNPRRKRKAKGWFCPVCRQPYTSLLRITTSPVPPITQKEESGPGAQGEPAASTSAAGAAAANGTTEVASGGLLGNMLRPNFLRGLTLRNQAPPPPTDVESVAGLSRQGA